MTTSIYIIVAVLVLAVLGGVAYTYKSNESLTVDHFNIATDPVIVSTPYEVLKDVGTCPKRPEVLDDTQYGGLNPKSNANLTLTDYINTYGTGENYDSYDTADVTSRRYCNLMYVVNNEYFSDRWSSTSECELDAKAQCQELFPNAPKKSYFGSP
ncbi:MAG: hypothetical protein WCO49_19090 [Nostocales cyanobacterium ELA608]